jgi:hypothetical protein
MGSRCERHHIIGWRAAEEMVQGYCEISTRATRVAAEKKHGRFFTLPSQKFIDLCYQRNGGSPTHWSNATNVNGTKSINL